MSVSNRSSSRFSFEISMEAVIVTSTWTDMGITRYEYMYLLFVMVDKKTGPLKISYICTKLLIVKIKSK
jgi:hypothetical protein